MRRQFFLFVVALVFLGCASSVNNLMQSWVGHSADELMMKWGPPTQVVDGPAGGKFIIYRSSYDYTTVGVPATAPTVVTNGYIDEYGNFHATTQ